MHPPDPCHPKYTFCWVHNMQISWCILHIKLPAARVLNSNVVSFIVMTHVQLYHLLVLATVLSQKEIHHGQRTTSAFFTDWSRKRFALAKITLTFASIFHWKWAIFPLTQETKRCHKLCKLSLVLSRFLSCWFYLILLQWRHSLRTLWADLVRVSSVTHVQSADNDRFEFRSLNFTGTQGLAQKKEWEQETPPNCSFQDPLSLLRLGEGCTVLTSFVHLKESLLAPE